VLSTCRQCTVQGMNLFCVVQTAVIVSLDSRMTGLSRALRVFEDTDLHLVHIESRRHKVSKVIVNITFLNLDDVSIALQRKSHLCIPRKGIVRPQYHNFLIHVCL
jgi:hypothetical protein